MLPVDYVVGLGGGICVPHIWAYGLLDWDLHL